MNYKKEILYFLAFVVAPGGIALGATYYTPKIKRWYQARKEKEALEKGNDKTDGKVR